MYFDRLNEIYVMVQSNFQFDKLVKTSLTGSYERSDRSVQIAQKTLVVPILGVNICPLFFSKACVLRNISPSPKMHLNNEKHLSTNHVLL